MESIYNIAHYERNGKDIFQDWLDDLKDLRAKTTILRILKRIENGNLGVHRFCRDGVSEFVIDVGPGYRIYYSVIKNIVVLLLCAGSKSTQQKDIDNAVQYLKNFKKENNINEY